MFTPPFCPYRRCSNHRAPEPRFFRRHGSYRPKCRSAPVPRFRCRACQRTFSRQTFRADYRDHRPHLNVELFRLLASGIGLRQSARNLGLTRRNTNLKFRKIARHLRRLNVNLAQPLSGVRRFHFDELETYEGQRNTRPLTVPVLVESESRYIVWAESAPIRPRGIMTKKRLDTIRGSESRFGIRRDGSRRAIRRTLQRARPLLADETKVDFQTDEKLSYPALLRGTFGNHLRHHETTNSKVARTVWNPLFPVNHEEAVMRDLMGRLRRESWLVSKRRRFLDLGLQLHAAYRNLVRRRFNRDEKSPAQILGLLPQRLSLAEVLSWGQAWGRRSVHPLSRRGESLGSWQLRNRAA